MFISILEDPFPIPDESLDENSDLTDHSFPTSQSVVRSNDGTTRMSDCYSIVITNSKAFLEKVVPHQ